MTFPASTMGGGMSQAFPDTCNIITPAGPVPTPFPNMCMINQAVSTSTQVTMLNQPVVLKNSQVPSSTGDEGGTGMGVASGMIKGPCKPTNASSTVKVEGQQVVYSPCPFGHNGTSANAPLGVQSTPSQSTVLVMG